MGIPVETPASNLPAFKSLRAALGLDYSMFARAVARAAALGRQARIVIAGHSHVAGEGAGTGTLGLQGCAALGFSGVLASKLSAKGIPCELQSFFGDYNAPLGGVQIEYLDPRITRGSGWVSDSAATTFGGRFLKQAATEVGKLDFVPGYTFESLRFWYPRTSGQSNSVQVLVDDVVRATISQAGGQALQFTDVAFGGSKVSILNTAASGTAFVLGIECNRRGPGAKIIRGGTLGAAASLLAANSSPFSSLPIIGALAADLGIYNCMANDIPASTPAATWKTHAKTVITKFLETAEEALLVIDPPSSLFSTPLYDQYEAAAYEIADETGCSILNLRSIFVSYAASVAAGTQYDTNHPNAVGYDNIGMAMTAA